MPRKKLEKRVLLQRQITKIFGENQTVFCVICDGENTNVIFAGFPSVAKQAIKDACAKIDGMQDIFIPEININ